MKWKYQFCIESPHRQKEENGLQYFPPSIQEWKSNQNFWEPMPHHPSPRSLLAVTRCENSKTESSSVLIISP